jgi:type IV secretory pathway TrbL component
MINSILLMLAFVLFAVGAYLTPDLPAKLTRAALAVAALAFLLTRTL